jgi:hypothetical protein
LNALSIVIPSGAKRKGSSCVSFPCIEFHLFDNRAASFGSLLEGRIEQPRIGDLRPARGRRRELNFKVAAYEPNQPWPIDRPRNVAVFDSELSYETVIRFVFLFVKSLVVLFGFMAERLDDVDIEIRIA